MKRVCLLLLLCCAVLAAWPQSAGPEQRGTVPQSGIAQARERIGRSLDAEEVQCQTRFSVTDCIDSVRARRRAMVSDFNRQEARINDAQRQQRSAEQLQSLERKAAEGARRQVDAASRPVTTEQERRDQQAQKQREHAAAQQPAAKAAEVRKADHRMDSAERVQNRARYAERQSALELRRAELAARLRARKPDTPTLPVPP